MTALVRAATLLDRLGGRSLLARFATMLYARHAPIRRFSVDPAGRWVNAQTEASVVSPVIHTTPYADYRAWVLDHWCDGYMPKPGDTVIDVGAGIGEEAVVFSHLVGPTGRVIAIEAHPQIYISLCETVRRSGLVNVTPQCVAVGDHEGIVQFAEGDNFLTGSIVAVSDRADTTVPLRTLDTIACDLDLGEIALVKMNIEGAETAAVAGMPELARRTRNVIVSCHDFLAERGEEDSFRTREQVRLLLEGYGYSLTSRPEHRDAWARDYLCGSRD
jgi:FkbM family methyltransferase